MKHCLFLCLFCSCIVETGPEPPDIYYPNYPQYSNDLCGDGYCSYDEYSWCSIDCGYNDILIGCGDYICDSYYEDYYSCPSDCVSDPWKPWNKYENPGWIDPIE